MPRKPLSEEIVDEMYRMSNMGMFATEIGKSLSLSSNTVRKYLYSSTINGIKRKTEIKRSRNPNPFEYNF